MTNKRALLLISVIAITFSVWYLKHRFYDSSSRLKIASKEVQFLTANNTLHEGDIIFQTSLSAQSQAIQLATHSPYSHCGLVFKNNDGYYVLEAVQPVKTTPLDKWIAHGKGGHYVVKRLKDEQRILTPQAIAKMKAKGKQLIGKQYDQYFEWSDDRMYCSEIVWKLYHRSVGIEVGRLQQLKDFDLGNALVTQKLHQRYGNHIPLNEKVISPAGIFNSEQLIQVADN